MKGAAEFCLDWLIEDGRGHLTTCPSESTENNFLAPDGRRPMSAGCTMDMALIAELFGNCIAAARLCVTMRSSPRGSGRRVRGSFLSRSESMANCRNGPKTLKKASRGSGTCRTCIRCFPGAGSRLGRLPPGQSRAGFAGTAVGRGRSLYGMEPRLGHQFLGAPGGWRASL